MAKFLGSLIGEDARLPRPVRLFGPMGVMKKRFSLIQLTALLSALDQPVKNLKCERDSPLSRDVDQGDSSIVFTFEV